MKCSKCKHRKEITGGCYNLVGDCFLHDKFETDKYFEFFNSVSCLFAEGVEFMTKEQIYDAIKKDWEKCRKEE